MALCLLPDLAQLLHCRTFSARVLANCLAVCPKLKSHKSNIHYHEQTLQRPGLGPDPYLS